MNLHLILRINPSYKKRDDKYGYSSVFILGCFPTKKLAMDELNKMKTKLNRDYTANFILSYTAIKFKLNDQDEPDDFDEKYLD